MQRFALATFYYSTNGANWSHGGWLESKTECDWYSGFDIVSSPECVVQGLLLSGDNLSGRIPIEVGLLGHLTQLNVLENELTGSIPSEIGVLTKLWDLTLRENQLTGSLPSELTTLAPKLYWSLFCRFFVP